ncbi:RNA polymerase sigma-70 factor (ECF subfamily) [Nakamurella sp. UYEF19]|uniref:RNA polymerase sigma factor n=1 Tax=Nakamurella sp. UYEF19 TaxID=1756392 RepID=UPI00339A9D5A
MADQESEAAGNVHQESGAARTGDVAATLDRAMVEGRLRIVAGLIRLTGEWELAEDCVQDAAIRALDSWPRDGIPDKPLAWLTTTAHRRAVDVLRRRRTEREKLVVLQRMSERDPTEMNSGDDRLALLFTCCHPALPLAGRVALTLKTVSGLSTREVARAFLVSEATMGQRLLRTRNKIAHAGISLQVPAPHRMAERTAGVLAVIYLLFNEGYSATDGDGVRDDLAVEALTLSSLLAALLPDDDEVHGLRALLLLQQARRAARVDAVGDLIPMDEQDRSCWNQREIANGISSLLTSRRSGRPAGQYRLQAEIAAVHSTAPTPDETDWGRIVESYDALLRLQDSPVIALNRAVAIGFRDGPEGGLSSMAQVQADPRLAGYHLIPAVRADLLRRAGRASEAIEAYRGALEQARTTAERRFLHRRLRELGGPA